MSFVTTDLSCRNEAPADYASREAEAFYEVHKARPFYAGLVKSTSEAPVLVMVLERDAAIAKWREVMGATNPANAAEGTIRKRSAENIERNAVHGSDAAETAAQEIPFFFSAAELLYSGSSSPTSPCILLPCVIFSMMPRQAVDGEYHADQRNTSARIRPGNGQHSQGPRADPRR